MQSSSADSPNELGDLDPGKAYIIGGIVDRNRHKNLCAGKAAEQGIATARLPVSQFFKLSASAVLTVNQARRQPVRPHAAPGSLCVAQCCYGCFPHIFNKKRSYLVGECTYCFLFPVCSWMTGISCSVGLHRLAACHRASIFNLTHGCPLH